MSVDTVYDIGGEIVEIDLETVYGDRNGIWAKCRSQDGRNFGYVPGEDGGHRLFATASQAYREACWWVWNLIDAETRPFPLGSTVCHTPTGRTGVLLPNSSTWMTRGHVVVQFDDGAEEVIGRDLTLAKALTPSNLRGGVCATASTLT